MLVRYPIRPQPQNGEALTAYMMRVAERNATDFFDMVTYISNDRQRKFYKKFFSAIDIAPDRAIKLSLLSTVLNQPIAELKTLTFAEATNKFPGWASKGPISGRISPLIQKETRRYCPICINQGATFQLLWQVKEIKIFHTHRVMLKEFCDFCGAPQPYVAQNLVLRGRCQHCNEWMGHNNHAEPVHDEAFTKLQMRYYRDWNFLVSRVSDSEIILNSDNKELAIAVLYAAQCKSGDFQREAIEVLHPYNVSRILWAIKSGYQKPVVSVQQLLEILRRKNIEIDTFTRTRPPESYKRSIFSATSPSQGNPDTGNCAAPWCRFYGSKIGMASLPRIKNRFHYGGKLYTNTSVCTGCYVVYANSCVDKKWVEINDLIETGWKKVRILLDQLDNRKGIRSIAEHLKITTRRATRLAAYLVRHRLVADDVVKRFAPRIVPENTVQKFKELDQCDGKLDALTKQFFGWSLFEHFYFMSGYDILHYLHLETTRHKKKATVEKGVSRTALNKRVEQYLEKCLQEGKAPSTAQVAEALHCSQSLLRTHKLLTLIQAAKFKLKPHLQENLKKKAEEYLVQTPWERVNKEVFCSSLGTTRHSLKRNFPDFYKWLSDRFQQHVEHCREAKYTEMVELIPQIVHSLRQEGVPVNQENVVVQLGMSINIFRRVGALGEAYREAAATFE